MARLAFLAISPGGSTERMIPVHDRLWVGRECAGIDDEHRFLIDDRSVSRQHFEIRLDEEQDCAYLFDTSTNGTRINGVRVERAVAVPLKAGDRIDAGSTGFEFRSEGYLAAAEVDLRQTIRNVTLSRLVLVAGDIIRYSSISQQTDERLLLESLETLYGELRKLLGTHHGTLNNYVGDAVFAIWDLEHTTDATAHALRFALDAVATVNEIAPQLGIRDIDGQPIRMGWGVAVGRAAVSTLTGALVSVLGDSTNLAFRLSGLAGRAGRGDILATGAARELAGEGFSWGLSAEVEVKGRTGTETVFEVLRA